MQLISMIEIGPTDKFSMIVVKQKVIVFGSTRTFNAVEKPLMIHFVFFVATGGKFKAVYGHNICFVDHL